MASAIAHGADVDLKTIEHDRVLAAADKYMLETPDTITSHPVPKEIQPPGWTLHDFYSEGDYYWQDPANPNAPYVSRDGQSNPTMFMDHRRPLWKFDIGEPALVSAYLLTGDKKYADKAIEHLRAWFVTPETRMNPSLTFAQTVRNKNHGSVFGIIDTLHLVEAARSVVVLRAHHAISAEDDAAITAWFTDYLHWLRTADNAIKESNATNNHATAYWVQVAAFAQVTNDAELTGFCRYRFKEQLLPQMNGLGGFNRELARTKPYGYSLFDLDLMVMLAELVSTPEDNLFTYTLPNGRNLKLGTEFMYPFVVDKSQWKKPPDVMVYDLMPVRSPSWLYAGRAFGEEKYLTLWKKLEANPTNEEVLRNLPIRQPLLWEK